MVNLILTTDVLKMIIEHEGMKLKPYRCTAGKLTIGVGRNLDDNGITEEEAEHLLANDVGNVEQELSGRVRFIGDIDDIRYSVLVDMGFNMGVPSLMKFKNMWRAIEKGDYKQAAAEMLDSKWARQVGNRSKRLAKMMETGTYVEKWW